MTHHSELINYIIETFDLRSYLEIGVYNRDHNFNKIKCHEKHCVDPDKNAKADFVTTSDEFFNVFNTFKCTNRFGLVFIDGLHYADQVRKDFNNAIEVIANPGFIVMHDCNPPTEKTTCIPRGKQGEWCGDVYKFACSLNNYKGIDFITADFDYGCTIAWKDWTKQPELVPPVDWKLFDKHRRELLRLTPIALVAQKLLSLQRTVSDLP